MEKHTEASAQMVKPNGRTYTVQLSQEQVEQFHTAFDEMQALEEESKRYLTVGMLKELIKNFPDEWTVTSYEGRGNWIAFNENGEHRYSINSYYDEWINDSEIDVEETY